MDSAMQNLYDTIQARKTEKTEGSYTCYLLEQGLDKILKKVGEEAAETIIAAKNGDGLLDELADLTYHLLVLMAIQDIPLNALTNELQRRAAKIGNKKKTYQSDHES